MRSRVIKPEFWSDEKLANISRELRLFFVGLWCVADDQGVTHASPALLRSQLFPYDETLTTPQVQGWVTELSRLGFVIPYTAQNGENYLYIANFNRHQRIDHPSKKSFNPPPEGGLESFSRNLREPSRDLQKTAPQTEVKLKQKLKLKLKEHSCQRLAPLTPAPIDLTGLWIDLTKDKLPGIAGITPTRLKKIKARLNDTPKEIAPEVYWRQVILRIVGSAFCRGNGSTGWRASFDWLLQPEVHLKVMEGKYDDRPAGQREMTPAQMAVLAHHKGRQENG